VTDPPVIDTSADLGASPCGLCALAVTFRNLDTPPREALSKRLPARANLARRNGPSALSGGRGDHGRPARAIDEVRRNLKQSAAPRGRAISDLDDARNARLRTARRLALPLHILPACCSFVLPSVLPATHRSRSPSYRAVLT